MTYDTEGTFGLRIPDVYHYLIVNRKKQLF